MQKIKNDSRIFSLKVLSIWIRSTLVFPNDPIFSITKKILTTKLCKMLIKKLQNILLHAKCLYPFEGRLRMSCRGTTAGLKIFTLWFLTLSQNKRNTLSCTGTM